MNSGIQWEVDPAGNANSHDGRTIRRDVRSSADGRVRAIAKMPSTTDLQEIYSIGMERVAYVLARKLDLPVPATHLEELGGVHHSIQMRVENTRSWRQAPAAPMMIANVTNRHVYAKAALFDVWIANVDRRDVNLMFEPEPPGTRPGVATACRLWLIDHGHCGLWPAVKFGTKPDEIPEDEAAIDGSMIEKAEQAIRHVMPSEYAGALISADAGQRDQLLDGIRAIGDDAIRDAVMGVPDAYMSAAQREATVAFFIRRQTKLDTVLKQYW